jgi:hypothetical protein
MKTITELNGKIWYRLLKVFFLLFVLLCNVFSIILITDEHKPRQVKDYKIECKADYSNRQTGYAEKFGIYIFQYGDDTIYQSLTDDTKKKLREICDVSDEEAENANAEALAYIREQENKNTSKITIQNYIDTLRPYTISEASITKGSHLVVIFYSLISIIISIIIIEIIRRIFYYIALGSLKPQK